MAAPLTPTPSAALNYSTPTELRHEPFNGRKAADRTENHHTDDDGDINNSSGNSHNNSSPFRPHLREEVTSPTPRGGPSPPKAARPGSRIITGNELSPLKILQQNQIQAAAHQQQQQHSRNSSQSPPRSAASVSPPAKNMSLPPQSPRKTGPPIKRFPVKVSPLSAGRSESPRRSVENERRSSVVERRPSLASVPETVPENEEGRFAKHVIDIFEDDDVDMDDHHNGHNGVGMMEEIDEDGDHAMSMGHDTRSHQHQRQHDEEQQHEQSHTMHDEDYSAADDTMMSTFSTFSTVPNLTMLAQMRSDSPTKFSGATPRAGSGPAPLRTPRANGGSSAYDSSSNSTTNLMDFTEQMRSGGYGVQQTPSRRVPQTPRTARGPGGHNNDNMVAATPQRNNLANLLDFDIPPAPTPRSIPTITPRELESLKSGFLSEISSLKASLSGKEAEVLSLKTAVGDAEKRVGECMEQLREVEGVQEALQTEKDSWERRGREMETVLRKVKEEIGNSQREREELEFKLDEAEKRREAAEMMAQDAESKMAGMRAGKASAEAAAAAAGGETRSLISTNKEVENAVERAARDLHALYKSKHETKVAALKKSYENRWDKRVRELQRQVNELTQANDDLRRNHGSQQQRIDPARLAELEEERRADKARNAAQIRELEAEVEKVEAVLKTVQADNADLRVLLERERVEKGELVQLAEEMMNMQSMQSFVAASEEPEPQPQAHHQTQQVHHTPAPASTAKTPNRRQSTHNNTSRTPGTGLSHGLGPGPAGGNSFRMSTGPNSFRASGLRAPGSSGIGMGLGGGASGIGKPSGIGRGPHERTKSAAVMGSHGAGGGLVRLVMVRLYE
ncbi:uncharacterized protein C8A04DRAFT_36863 [Dichotomopilus funicola]|uniref:Uncharacterized protein n=1 Tax=Dichotomopilus funicola TaxID=1934379 RepID=A0AAN6V3J8_9PEZI|nr:hypothetical protein C8A04DRAFT_36863 [Dichotomopilus funicola]